MIDPTPEVYECAGCGGEVPIIDVGWNQDKPYCCGKCQKRDSGGKEMTDMLSDEEVQAWLDETNAAVRTRVADEEFIRSICEELLAWRAQRRWSIENYIPIGPENIPLGPEKEVPDSMGFWIEDATGDLVQVVTAMPIGQMGAEFHGSEVFVPIEELDIDGDHPGPWRKLLLEDKK